MVGGVTSLCTLALLNAGVSKDDPQIQAVLGILRQVPPNANYPTALQTMVFALAEPEKDALLIRRNVRWIEEQQKRDPAHRGMWSYPLATATIRIRSSPSWPCTKRSGPASRLTHRRYDRPSAIGLNRKIPTARGAMSRGIRGPAA